MRQKVGLAPRSTSSSRSPGSGIILTLHHPIFFSMASFWGYLKLIAGVGRLSSYVGGLYYNNNVVDR